MRCRDDLVNLKVMEELRLQPTVPAPASSLPRTVHAAVRDALVAQIAVVTAEIAALIAADPELAARAAQLRTVPGLARC